MYHTTYDATTKTWTGPKTLPVYNPKVSAAQVILNALNNNPNKIGQISDNNGIQMKNSEIRKKTIHAAQRLHKMGFGKNYVICILCRNHHHLAPIVFASIALAAPLSPMDPNSTADGWAIIMKTTKPKLIFCEADQITAVQEALKQLVLNIPIFTIDRKVDGARLVDELFIDTGANINHFVPTDIEDGFTHLLIMLLTSGSTGASKIIGMSHAAGLDMLSKFLVINGEDVLISFMTLFGLTGFGTMLATTVSGAIRIITTENFRPELMLNIIEKYKVSVTVTSPGHLAQLVQSKALASANLSSMIKYNCGGSVTPTELCSRINKFLPRSIYVAYGMSEMAGIITLNFPEPRAGSVGQLGNGTTLKIVDDDGNRCGIGENGEICYLLQIPFLGYYTDGAFTDIACVDSDRWLHSGDVGHFDEDGFLFVLDRKTDIIKYRGYTISPSQVEAEILKHPGVVTVCVVGVPDAMCTELPASVVLKNAAVNVTEQEIIDIVKDSLPDYMQIRGGVYIADSLPISPFGKIYRPKVKNMAIEMYNQRSK